MPPSCRILASAASSANSRRIFPIHASTQMTITSAAGVEFRARTGCDLVVFGGECSIKEIARIAPTAGLPLEVFVHGALCVAYSGQCLTSESLADARPIAANARKPAACPTN